MNETSNGPRSVVWGLAAALFGGLAATIAGCPGPAPMAATGGSGGSSTSDSSSSSSSTTSSTSSSTGGAPCMKASDCPVPSKECAVATCAAGVCGAQPATPGTPCTDDGGKFCDANGQCVDCVSSKDCVSPANNPCVGSKYTPSVCNSGKCEDGEVVDCAMTHQVCKPSGCMDCVGDTECGPVSTAAVCTVPTCTAGKCGPGNAAPGTPCMSGNGNGTCDANGACLVPKYVFVTSAAFSSSFGGTQGADDACKNAAETAGLDGTWLSWTSDSMKTAAGRFMQSAAPYLLLDDTPVADHWMELTSGMLAHGIRSGREPPAAVPGPGVDGNRRQRDVCRRIVRRLAGPVDHERWGHRLRGRGRLHVDQSEQEWV
ncbi:MAG: hypothetical protein QM820_01850 [Minicystis sp.]